MIAASGSCVNGYDHISRNYSCGTGVMIEIKGKKEENLHCHFLLQNCSLLPESQILERDHERTD